jgi:hypothetical protein
VLLLIVVTRTFVWPMPALPPSFLGGSNRHQTFLSHARSNKSAHNLRLPLRPRRFPSKAPFERVDRGITWVSSLSPRRTRSHVCPLCKHRTVMEKGSRKMRSFRGCKACKKAKRRCSESRPACALCLKAGRKCEVSCVVINLLTL